MKRSLITVIIMGSLVLPFRLYAQDPFKICKPVTLERNGITVGVLPQVELISIVQEVSKYAEVFDFLMAEDTSAYRREVIDYFSLFKDHPVVAMFNRLSLQPRMLNFSAPSNIMLFTDDVLGLRTDIEPEQFVIDRAGGADSLRLFLSLLRDFAVKSSFNDFFREHHDFYLEITDNTIQQIGPENFIGELESFYGRSQRSYNIILVPLYGHVGYGNSLLHPGGQRDIFNTMGPRGVTDGLPSFGDRSYLTYMIRHEFSHPFVNPLTEKYWDPIKDYSGNYNSIPEVARKNVCGDWQECINEFTIRAITTFLAYNESADAGARAYSTESAAGVSYLDALLKSIRQYDFERDKYPTFESYLPHIFEVFRGGH